MQTSEAVFGSCQTRDSLINRDMSRSPYRDPTCLEQAPIAKRERERLESNKSAVMKRLVPQDDLKEDSVFKSSVHRDQGLNDANRSPGPGSYEVSISQADYKPSAAGPKNAFGLSN